MVFNFDWQGSYPGIYVSVLCYGWGGYVGVYLPIDPSFWSMWQTLLWGVWGQTHRCQCVYMYNLPLCSMFPLLWLQDPDMSTVILYFHLTSTAENIWSWFYHHFRNRPRLENTCTRKFVIRCTFKSSWIYLVGVPRLTG